MYECCKPLQFIKEDSKDFLVFKGNKYYVYAKYGSGRYEISKKEYERLESRGMRVKAR